jgi:hypothetical protein
MFFFVAGGVYHIMNFMPAFYVWVMYMFFFVAGGIYHIMSSCLYFTCGLYTCFFSLQVGFTTLTCRLPPYSALPYPSCQATYELVSDVCVCTCVYICVSVCVHMCVCACV